MYLPLWQSEKKDEGRKGFFHGLICKVLLGTCSLILIVHMVLI
jgi:hypothetical protein